MRAGVWQKDSQRIEIFSHAGQAGGHSVHDGGLDIPAGDSQIGFRSLSERDQLHVDVSDQSFAVDACPMDGAGHGRRLCSGDCRREPVAGLAHQFLEVRPGHHGRELVRLEHRVQRFDRDVDVSQMRPVPILRRAGGLLCETAGRQREQDNNQQR